VNAGIVLLRVRGLELRVDACTIVQHCWLDPKLSSFDACDEHRYTDMTTA